MVNTKENIWVEGYNSRYELKYFCETTKIRIGAPIYYGKTSEIPEEILEKCIPFHFDRGEFYYPHYTTPEGLVFWTNSRKQSIQSALTKPDGSVYQFCIIFRKE